MARRTLVLDASVGVKWFSDIGEPNVPQARAIMRAHAGDNITLLVPDLFFHEVANALVHKKTISADLLEESMTALFDLNLSVVAANEERICTAVRIARKAGITEYDAYYAAAAIEHKCPLVTANPRHQGRTTGCQVIHIEQWEKT